MVNGNYVLYGDKPSSESEIVDDHVHTRTAERKHKRKVNRTANELQNSLNTLAQLDNETDSVKYEKKIKEPRLLRYVPTTDVEENFVTERFETYDMKPTEELPRRYGFTKKPKNPTDGSVNYAYSRSSSSSPNNNLPTIAEHCEQFGTYRVRTSLSKRKENDSVPKGYESKLDKYFAKPRDLRKFGTKVNYNGTHPDSLYRVPTSSGVGAGKMARVLRALRWPAALIVVCAALAVFVYFLMPDNLDIDSHNVNSTYWETSAVMAGAPVVAKAGIGLQAHPTTRAPTRNNNPSTSMKTSTSAAGTRSKTPEIDFYDTDNAKNVDLISVIDSITTKDSERVLPIAPVFPKHLTPEVQYGNEKADAEKARTPKILDGLDDRNRLPDTTLKPHITQKPEKPLAIYFKDAVIPTIVPETILRSESINNFSTKQKVQDVSRRYPTQYKVREKIEDTTPPENQEYYRRRAPNDNSFTSGHSKFFGIGIEDADRMTSTTQSSLYNTRVSPTLPTWRDGDDSTTKHYPNLNTDVPQCHSPRLALCRGVLPYDLAGPPPTINGVDITTHLAELEYLVSTNCSERVRQFVCALLEPECNPPPFPPNKPCYSLCKAVTDNCEAQIAQELIPAFRCKQYDNTNCMSARTPCYRREMSCADGTCIPRDWICDGTTDCPNGEDEKTCVECDKNQFRCQSGTCIMKRWLCDGYLDCSDGEDENEDTCRQHGVEVKSRAPTADEEPGEELAGSAPAPSVHRPNKLPEGRYRSAVEDSSKELLITSDSSNALKRNYTRRPSPSLPRAPSPARLTPYRPKPRTEPPRDYSQEASDEQTTTRKHRKFKPTTTTTTVKPVVDTQTDDDIDLRFFDDFVKDNKEAESPKFISSVSAIQKLPIPARPRSLMDEEAPANEERNAMKFDKNTKTIERHFDGAALLRKAAEEEEQEKARLRNITTPEEFPDERAASSSHSSPCPSGELRCVDGLCITLAQLCDGTIDCTDHADEDNCYT